MSFLGKRWCESASPTIAGPQFSRSCTCMGTYLAYPQFRRETTLEEVLNLKQALSYVNDVHAISFVEERAGLALELKGDRSLALINFILPPDWVMKKVPDQVPGISLRTSILNT